MNNKKKDNYGNLKKNIFGNVSSMLSAKVTNVLCGIVVSILLARYLGAERQGIISYALSIYGMFSFFSVFGLPDIIVREFSQNKENSKETAKSAMALMLLGGGIAGILSIGIAIRLEVTKQVLLFVVLYAIENLSQFLRVFEQWLYSIAKTKPYSIAQIIIHLLFLGFKIIGIILKQDIIWFVLCTVFEVTFTNISLVLCYWIVKQPFDGEGRVNIERIKKLLRSCWPLIIVSAANTIYMRIDQIMVGKMLNEIDLGLYSIGVTLAEYWYFVPSIIYSSFLPSLAERKNEEISYYQLLQHFADGMIMTAYVAVIGFSIGGKLFIPMLYGAEYTNSSIVLSIYIWAGFFISLSYVDQITYILSDNTRIIMFTNIISAVLNIVLNALLIPVVGIYGAALATTLDHLIVRIMIMIIFWRKYKMTYLVQIKSLLPFSRLYRYLGREKG